MARISYLLRCCIKRSKNILLVLFAVSLGILIPDYSQYTQPLVTVLVVFLVYSSLRDTDINDMDVRFYGCFITISVGISYFLLPVVGIQIVDHLVVDRASIGFAIMLSAPTTAGSAIIWTRLSGGDVELSTIMSVISLMIAPIMTPLLLLFLIDSQINVPVYSVVANLGVILIGAISLNKYLPPQRFSEKTINVGTEIAILVLIYSSVGGLDVGYLPAVELAEIISTSFLLLGIGGLLSFVLGYLLLENISEVLSLFFTSSLKNLGIALLVAFSFSSSIAIAVIIIYYVAQQLLGATIADLDIGITELTPSQSSE